MTENDKKAIAFKDALIDFAIDYQKKHGMEDIETMAVFAAMGEMTKKYVLGAHGAIGFNEMANKMLREKMN
jgi:hypothetical protein